MVDFKPKVPLDRREKVHEICSTNVLTAVNNNELNTSKSLKAHRKCPHHKNNNDKWEVISNLT
jgi:hypothetical protein